MMDERKQSNLTFSFAEEENVDYEQEQTINEVDTAVSSFISKLFLSELQFKNVLKEELENLKIAYEKNSNFRHSYANIFNS